jgi:hypothetical protein
MALVTKMLDIAVSDYDAGRITVDQLMSIFQEAIDNGDIAEPGNELCVVGRILPLVDHGVLRSSEHLARFESHLASEATKFARESRMRDQQRK